MKEKLMNMLEEREDEIIQIRRHLHEYPELSFKEEKTAQYIADFYKDKDVDCSNKCWEWLRNYCNNQRR